VRRRTIIHQRTLEAKTALLKQEEKHEEAQPEVPQVKEVKGRKMCPHCGEVPAYHFHVIKCAKK
jgi:hypothetical protein